MSKLQYPDDYYDFEKLSRDFVTNGIAAPNDLQLRCIKGVLRGRSRDEIAFEYSISPSTVSGLLGKSIYALVKKKLDLDEIQQVQAIAYLNQNYLKLYALRTERPANIFWSGHDIMWTIHAAEHRYPCGDVRHGLEQLIFQVDNAKVFNKCSSIRIVKEEWQKLKRKNSSSILSDEEYESIVELLKGFRKELGAVINSFQGENGEYEPYPNSNYLPWSSNKKKKLT